MISFPKLQPRLASAALMGAFLLLEGCSGGQEKPILAPTIKASLAQSAPVPKPASDGVVYFGNVGAIGDTIFLDVLIQDLTGTLDLDDVDLVLRYDATFIQISSLSGQDTLFGTCNTVNPACGVNSPICADNRRQANGGGEEYCRSTGSTFCTQDADCTSTGDACGSFGRLEAAFAVLTGPKVCSNNPGRACSQSSDCRLCQSNPAVVCSNAADCSGTCSPANTCTNLPGRSCLADADCVDACGSGLCQGCPSVVVGGVRKIASLTLRVMKQGTGDFRFVVSSQAGTGGSAARKDLADLPVDFWPNVDSDDLSRKEGDIVVVGTL